MLTIVKNLKVLRASNFNFNSTSYDSDTNYPFTTKTFKRPGEANTLMLEDSSGTWTLDYLVPVHCNYDQWVMLRDIAFPDSQYRIREHY